MTAPKTCTKCCALCSKEKPACRWWGICLFLPGAAIESRHLGLKTAAEIADLQARLKLLADAAQSSIDWPLLQRLFDRPAPAAAPPAAVPPRVRLAVARDAAFCFTYAETLEALQENGAELCFLAHCRIRPCRRTLAGCTCRAATRSFTPPSLPPTRRCAPP